MNYEEKYKEVLERAREELASCGNGRTKMLERIFPELAESEDEKIRKWIINEIKIKHHNLDEENVDFIDKAIAWLERQGEHANFRNKIQVGDKVTRNEAGVLVNLSQLRRVAIPSKKQGEKSADTVEPKFREGEWITNGDYTWIIVGVKPLDYVLQSQDGNIVDDTISHVDEQFHSFTVEDAKDGDVLATSAGAFIYNGNNGGGSCPGCYCGIDTLGRFKTGVEHHWTVKKVYPATKEQRTELFLKMHEAGYEWDVEKKELKKIEENNGNIGGISPNWSEEDDWMKKKIMLVLLGSETFLTPEETNELVYWLKSLKDRVQPKPQPKYNFGDTELTQEELCEGLIRGMVDEHNRVTKEVLRNEYEKGRADVLAKIDAIDVDEMVWESCATSRVTQYWYAHGVNDVIKKLKEE